MFKTFVKCLIPLAILAGFATPATADKTTNLIQVDDNGRFKSVQMPAFTGGDCVSSAGSVALNCRTALTPKVENNTALSALASTYATSIVRLGFSNAGDSPPVLYTPSNSACSLNAGAGDGGSQIRTSDGKCWIAAFGDKRDIRIFGGKDDGSTDNTAAFNAAIASLPSSGGTIIFPAVSTGVYAFTSGIVIGDGSSSAASTKQNIKLEGVPGIAGAAQSVGSAFAGNVPVKFKYTGSGQASVFLYVKGPIVWAMDGISLDCGASFKCDTALFTQHQFQSVIENVKIENFKVKGIREDAFPILPSGVAIGASNNRWKNVFVTSLNLSTAATGWDIGIASCVMATGCFDVSNNIYEMVEVQVPDIAGGASILLRGADNLTFQRSFTYQLTSGHVGTNAWGVYVLPPTGNFALPSEIVFINSPLVGGVYGTTDWACNSGGGRGITFLPFNDGDATNPAAGGKYIPTAWNTNDCLRGVTSSGSSIDQYQSRMTRGGTQYYGVSTLFRDMSARSVSNSTAATGLSSTTLPAYVMRAFYNPDGPTNQAKNDRKLRVRAAGVYRNNTGSSQNVTYVLSIGGTTVCTTSGMSIATAAAYGSWSFDATFSIRDGGTTTYSLDASGVQTITSGSLGTQFATCDLELGAAGSATASSMPASSARYKSAYDTFTIDMTSAQTLATTVTLGAASASLVFVQDQMTVELQ